VGRTHCEHRCPQRNYLAQLELQPMTQPERQQRVMNLLSNFRGAGPLKRLFLSELNYDRVNQPISRRRWAGTDGAALAEDPTLLAAAGTGEAFHVIYSRLASDRLPLGTERPIVHRLLRDHPYALFVFSNSGQDLWHFVNVKYDVRAEKRWVF
jgi:hypothetical protein